MKQAIARTDNRISATELMKPKPKKAKPPAYQWWHQKAKERFKQLRQPEIVATKEQEKEYAHAR